MNILDEPNYTSPWLDFCEDTLSKYSDNLVNEAKAIQNKIHEENSTPSKTLEVLIFQIKWKFNFLKNSFNIY